jgi:ribulose 1,5-bisphosphate carboxylase large subunit-like protein
MTLQEYCNKWNRAWDNNFALACIEQTTDQELENAARATADETDMETWHIVDAQEWYDAINAALEERELHPGDRD